MELTFLAAVLAAQLQRPGRSCVESQVDSVQGQTSCRDDCQISQPDVRAACDGFADLHPWHHDEESAGQQGEALLVAVHKAPHPCRCARV